MKENGHDLLEEVEFQGWSKYFDRLIDPVFHILVKELRIHASASQHQVTSYFMGKKIVITEDLIGRLIGHDGNSVKCTNMAKKAGSDLVKVSKEIFSSRQPSNKI